MKHKPTTKHEDQEAIELAQRLGASAGAACYNDERETFHLVFGWQKMGRTCTTCGATRSVKYDYKGKPYCNLCVLSAL